MSGLLPLGKSTVLSLDLKGREIMRLANSQKVALKPSALLNET
jgi:hypothetical protein